MSYVSKILKNDSIRPKLVKKQAYWADILQKHTYGLSTGTVKMIWVWSLFIELHVFT